MRREPESDDVARGPLDFPYTAADTPEARARIRSDLQRIVATARAHDPHLHALVLTGGFSRGEGTLRDGAPVNDYDLVAVRTRPGGGRLHGELARFLTQEIGIEVDLLPIWRRRVPHVGAKLFWLDARLGGRVLWGDETILARLPAHAPHEIPRQEIARLLGNRAAGLILALPGRGAHPDRHQVELQGAKAAIAAMDACLLSKGLYAPSLRDRLRMSRAHPHADTFARAVAWKLGDEASLEDDWWEATAAALLAAVEETGAEGCRDGLVEHAVHLLRAGRLRASPSQAVRRAAWSLLRESRFPEGPEPALAAATIGRLTRVPRGEWPALRHAFFDLRARTLQ